TTAEVHQDCGGLHQSVCNFLGLRVLGTDYSLERFDRLNCRSNRELRGVNFDTIGDGATGDAAVRDRFDRVDLSELASSVRDSRVVAWGKIQFLTVDAYRDGAFMVVVEVVDSQFVIGDRHENGRFSIDGDCALRRFYNGVLEWNEEYVAVLQNYF